MSSVPRVLLPPSEGKAPGGSGRWDPASGAFGELAARRAQVARAYATAVRRRDLAKVVGASGPLADRAREAGLLLAAGEAPVLPAHERFTGVVWEHLRAGQLRAPAHRRIAVVSALCGLVAGDDPVPDHRLKLSVSLGRLGRLDRWWLPHLTTALAEWAGGAPVWDLLPNEHARAIDFALLATSNPVVRVRFEGATGHFAKAAKGAFARALLLEGASAVDGRRAWWDGDDVVVRAG